MKEKSFGPSISIILALVLAAIAAALFLLGQLLGFRRHAIFLLIGAAVFLAVDFLVWWRFGIMPSVKFVRGGFMPAAIMDLFAGALYRIVAIPTPALPRDPQA